MNRGRGGYRGERFCNGLGVKSRMRLRDYSCNAVEGRGLGMGLCESTDKELLELQKSKLQSRLEAIDARLEGLE